MDSRRTMLTSDLGPNASLQPIRALGSWIFQHSVLNRVNVGFRR